MSWFKSTAYVLTGLALWGCGFEPLYGKRNARDVIAEFAYVQVAPIDDRVGQQLRNELLQRLYAGGRAPAVKYRLTATLTESTSSLAVKKSSLATRANLKMTASYSLAWVGPLHERPARSPLLKKADGDPQLTDLDEGALLTRSDAVTVSYNILDSEFATLMAERDARERAVRSLSEDIRIQLAVYFDRQQ